ncbi:type IV pilus modification PilV family protein [Poriferisphaera sp. WC338]|uniref:type IV pilus modification PilV family protein n=1 Tax=Poriferisphaera sp. WC338 TaxID=3425129 RepID=UPI003D816863
MNYKEHKLRSGRSRQYRRQGGFTLIEAALTTVIIGTGVLAIVGAQQAYHQKNDWATRTGTAMLLANEIREMTLNLPLNDPITGASNIGVESNEMKTLDDGSKVPDIKRLDDLDDFAGTLVGGTTEYSGITLSPPVNALREEVTDMKNWTQVVTIYEVPAVYLATEVKQPLTGDSEVIRVNVDVYYTEPNETVGDLVTNLTWVVTR